MTVTLPYPNLVYLPAIGKDHVSGAVGAYGCTVSAAGLGSGLEYYVAIKLEDGYNVAWHYSEVPVRKQ